MKILYDLLIGAAIGIANVIPGFSGGTMAVILKAYERIINALDEFTKHPFKVLKDVWAIILGLVIGIIIASFTIVYALNKFPLPTVLLFVGMIIGSIPVIYKETKDENIKFIKISEIISFIICFTIVIILPFLNKDNNVEDINFLNMLVVFIMGIISACAMLVPGISGSLVLMVFGYYILIIGNIKNFLSNFIHFNFSGLGQSFLILIIFALGCILGIILISKLIKILLNKHKRLVYISILGLLLASVFSIVYKTIIDYNEIINFNSVWLYIACVLCLAAGIFISILMTKLDNKYKSKQEEEHEDS